MLTKKNDMYWLESNTGEHITRFCSRLSRLALQMNNKVAGEFNGVTLVATPDTTAENLETEFHKQLRINQENYEKSPEYAKWKEKRAQELTNANRKAVELMTKLDSLNWDSFAAILDWLCDAQSVADHIGVTLDRNKIISEFIKHGFEINVNTGKNFIENDPDNHARYLIGQALDGFMQVGAPHGILISFTEKWKQRFGDAPVIIDAVVI